MEGVVLFPAGGTGKLSGELGDELLQVGAREEDVFDAGDDGDSGRPVVSEAAPRLRQGLEVGHVQRIAGLRPVDGDGHDVTLAGVVDAHAAHSRADWARGTLIRPARRRCPERL